LAPESLSEIERVLTLRCDFDTRLPGGEHARHTLFVFAVALQLVKPTRSFFELWLQLDHLGMPELASSPVRQLGFLIDSGVYLEYQQHNMLEEADVRRALGIAPMVAAAFDSRYGSWNHPVLPVHRALVFFCQGYSVKPSDPRQFLWAAGLDCLFASKLDRKKQGSGEITKRLEKLLGASLIPYDTVSLPTHQKARVHSTLAGIGKDIFKLRNAFAHGLSIPDPKWLTTPGSAGRNRIRVSTSGTNRDTTAPESFEYSEKPDSICNVCRSEAAGCLFLKLSATDHIVMNCINNKRCPD
jgi:hypothetical protein